MYIYRFLYLGCGALLATTSFVSAQSDAPAASSSSFSSGFYAGAKVGYERATTKFQDALDETPAGNPVVYPDVRKKSQNSAVGAVFVGAQKVFENGFLLGVDFEGIWGEKESKVTFEPDPLNAPGYYFHLKTKNRGVFVPGVLLGKTLTSNLLGYVKLGWGIAYDTFEVEAVRIRKKYEKGGVTHSFRPAVGVRYAFTPTFSLLGELTYDRALSKKAHDHLAPAEYFYDARINKPHKWGVFLGVVAAFG